MNSQNYKTNQTVQASEDLPALLARPEDVVNDPTLTLEQKRSTLAFWLSDLHAIPDAPRWRQLETGALVDVDDIYKALRALDEAEDEIAGAAAPRDKATFGSWIKSIIPGSRADDDDDPPPCPAVGMRPAVPEPGWDAGSALAEALIAA